METDLVKQLSEYFATRTPEQALEDDKLMEEWSHVGPTVDEYLKAIGFKCD